MADSLYGFEFREVDRRRSDREGTWDIKQLWDRNHEIIRMVSRGDLTQKEVAEQLGITPATVSNTVNSTLGQEKLSKMRKTRDERYEEINKEVLSLTEKALKVYDDIFGSDNASLDLQLKAANTITLDIAGMRAPTKIDTNFTADITKKETREFIIRGQAAAKASGFLTEVPNEGQSKERESIDVTPN